MKKVLKRIKNNKLLRYTGVGIIFLLLLLVARVTYAYFAADINAAQGNVVAGNDSVDALKFEVGDPLSLNVNSNTLRENGTNVVSSTTTKARLLANSTNNTASYDYYVYLNLTENTFVYSKENTPEIILSVVDPNGNEVTNISGLTYGTFNGISGFDVTTYEGMILLSQYNITSNSSTEETIQEWAITLTYLNQPYDQTINFGHSLKTEVLMKKDKFTFANYIINLAGTTQGKNNIYHHDGTILATEANAAIGVSVGDALDANDGSYRYAGSYENVNNWVCFGMDDEDKEYLSGWCDDEHLYRIIGVFDEAVIGEDGNPTGEIEKRIKLIKAHEGAQYSLGATPDGYLTINSSYYKGNFAKAPGYYWSGSSTNYSDEWNKSSLNIRILNNSYLEVLESYWRNKISITQWSIGSNEDTKIISKNAATAYQNEIVAPYANTITNDKVGLMYVSDYGFAASPENWITSLNSYNNDTNRNNNWMFFGMYEWTISSSCDGRGVYMISSLGEVTFDEFIFYRSIRPTFYLNSDVIFDGGTGTETDPYRIV